MLTRNLFSKVVSLKGPSPAKTQTVSRSNLKINSRPKTPLSSVQSHQLSTKFVTKRYLCTGRNPSNEDDGSILTVDKWGVQRNAAESKPKTGPKTNFAHGVPAEEMTVFELSRMNFQEVLQSEAPVIIMAFLPNSELCGQLDHKLQMRVHEIGGAVRLGRLNASVEQELASALKLTQLPTVIGVHGGKTISSFVGLPDDKTIEQFLNIMLRAGGQNQLTEMTNRANQLMEAGQMEEAIKIFSDILEEPTLKAEAIALAGLARCSILQDHLDQAEEFIEVIKNSYPNDLSLPQVVQAISAFELASGSSNINFDELTAKITSNPKDLEARYELATGLWAKARQEEAINHVLEMVKIDKNWNDQAARKFLLKIWESLGPDHPLTASSRKRFSSIWFS